MNGQSKHKMYFLYNKKFPSTCMKTITFFVLKTKCSQNDMKKINKFIRDKPLK